MTGYIRKAKESNALVETDELNKLYQLWIIEEGNSQSDIYATCDSFVNYVGSVTSNYENRINYTIISEKTIVQTMAYSLMSNEVTEGTVIFLFATSNGLYTTSSVSFVGNALANAMEGTAVHNNLQEATNNVFGGKEALQSTLDRWEYAVSGGTFDVTANRYLISLYNDSVTPGTFITSFYVRDGKILTKQFLDLNCTSINYYMFRTQEEGTYEMEGFYAKPSIIRWDLDNDGQIEAWDYSQSVQKDVNLIAVPIEDIQYDSHATIRRNSGSIYKEYTEGLQTELMHGVGIQNFYFSELALAIEFADKYLSQDTYYLYDVDAKQDGCSTTYVPREDYKSIRYENEVTYFDTIEVLYGKVTPLLKDATLKAGCKILIPCGDGKYGNQYAPALYKESWYNYIGRDPFMLTEPASKLVVSEGITLDVYGEIEVGAYTTTQANFVQNEVYVNGTEGGFGVLENNGTINIKNGGTLTSYGYTTGTGIINGLEGSRIIDMFVTYNWPGGTAASNVYKHAFIFNVYTVSNIRCHTTVNYGGEYIMYTVIYLPSFSDTETEEILLVSDSDAALFSFDGNKNATVEKKYNDGVTEIIINGDMVDNYFGISGMALENVYFPLYKFNITIESGNFNIRANKFMVMPGSSLVVKEKATITFSETGGLTALASMIISNANEAAKLPKEPGIIEVFGTITGTGVATGNIYVKENGSVETSNLVKYDEVVYGRGKIVAVSGTYPLQTDECLLTIISDAGRKYTVRYSDTATDVLVDPGTLLDTPTKEGHIFKGWYTTSTFDEETLVTTVDYSMIVYPKWELDTYRITYIDEHNVDNPNPTTYTIISEEIILTALTKEGYTFLGWFNGEALVTSIPTGSKDDITLTAKWEADPDVTTN